MTYGDNFAHHGASVAWLGDVDQDGFDDFIVGRPAGDCVGGPCLSGSAGVYSGLTGAVLHNLSMGVANDGFGTTVAFGWSLAVLGDVDGDGGSDLIIGAPWWNDQAGAAYVMSPASGKLIRTLEGPSPGARLGEAVGGCGDVNGDGAADALVAVPNQNQIYGSLKMLSGATGSTVFEVDSLKYWISPTVAGLPDINGDGVRDYALGAPCCDPNGAATVYSGASGDTIVRVEGYSADRFGASIGAGTLRDPSAPDLVVGAPLEGRIGAIHLFSMNGALESSLFGEAPGRFGAAIAVGGDANGDGRPDLVVGAPDVLHDNAFVGAAYVYALVDRLPARASLEGEATMVHLGAGGPEVCFRLEPPDGHSADEVILRSVVVRPASSAGPDFREIRAIVESSGTVDDPDHLFAAETRACFSRQDLQRLYPDLPAGTHHVLITLEGNLEDGSRVSAPTILTLDIPAASKVAVAPNPMRSEGSLTFRTATTGGVRVDLFDARGRHVRELLARPNAAAGYHSIVLDGHDRSGHRLAAGVYFYKVDTPDGSTTGRVVLLK